MVRILKGKAAVVGAVAASWISVSCGKSSSPAPAPAADGGDAAGDSSTSQNSYEEAVSALLSNAFPSSLALTVLSTSTGSSLRLAGDDEETGEEVDPNAKSLEQKIEDQEKIARGEADSCMPDAIGKGIARGESETCYEFDQDMIYGRNAADADYLGTLDGESASGEACLVSFSRGQVTSVMGMVDQTLGFGMAAICQHKKLNEDSSLPETGEAALDLAPALENLFGSKATVTSAKLERLEDVDDHPVYRMVIVATMGRDSIKRTIGIIHSPHDDENKEYSGTIYTIMEGVPGFAAGGGGNDGTTKFQHMSITYNRTLSDDGEPRLVAELRSAQINEDILAEHDAINDQGVLDLNVGTNIETATLGASGYGDYEGYAESNQAVNAITYVAFNLNPDSGEGNLAYWKNPGGNYYENARGFNIAVERNDDDQLAGCATSGSASTDFTAGTSIRRFLNDAEEENDLTLAPKGFWHPFMNTPTSTGTDADGSYKQRTQVSGQVTKWYVPQVSDSTAASTFVTSQNGSYITRQCFVQDADSGLYVIDTNEIDDAAGFELLDSGNTVNAAKFLALPERPERPAFENVKAEEE